MSLEIHHQDIRGQLVILGTGTSVGVPAIGCPCPVCHSANPQNQRLRCSVIAGLPAGNLLIDTTPDLRTQLLREQIGLVHAVAFTHEHADHVMGLDDLRLMQFYLGHPVPLYCTIQVESRIRKSFDYAFSDEEETHVGATPKLEFRRIDTAPFQALGTSVTPLRLQHGPRLEVLGFRIGNIAYCTDTNDIPEETFARLRNLDVLILDALRYRPHATHFALQEAVQVARRVAARQTYFTHICHDMEHTATNASLPDGMRLAYDGQRIRLA